MALVTSPDDAIQEHPSLTSNSTKTFDKAELLRQIHFYFCEENLRKDAHLLGKLEEGNGTVSIAQVTGWSRMRKFRPLSAVKEALKESTVIEVVNNKRIKLRQPFDMTKALVKPRIDEEERKLQNTAILKANPFLSKAMLKRTGFEHDHFEPDLTVEEQQDELEQYSIGLPVYVRLETAVLKYKMNRKFHQESLRVFHAFLNYGGFDERPASFTGGMNKEDEEGLSKEEKARRKQMHFVSDVAMQSLDEGDGKWVVDFEGVTKGFFSTIIPGQFLRHDDLEHDKGTTKAACNVLRNFFNYLLHHNVCAEYVEQINSARDALEVVEKEFVKLAEAQQVFPGAFSVACSILLDGYYSKIGYQGDWMAGEQIAGIKTGYSRQEARSIMHAGVAGYGNLRSLASALSKPVTSIAYEEEDVGLEVTTIVNMAEAPGSTQRLFEKLENTIVGPIGKLICKRIRLERAPPLDLPPSVREGPQSFEFLVDEETLHKCYPGLRFLADVKKTSSGFWFIDHWTECYGTFYTWCWNERARDYHENVSRFKLAKPKRRRNVQFALPAADDGTEGAACEDASFSAGIEQSISARVSPSLDANTPAETHTLEDKSDESAPKQEIMVSDNDHFEMEGIIHSSTDNVKAVDSMESSEPEDKAEVVSSKEEEQENVAGDDGFLSDEEFDD